MPKISKDALRQVRVALDQYENEVNVTTLRPSSKNTYILHARNFVRWLNDDFYPGAQLRSGNQER